MPEALPATTSPLSLPPCTDNWANQDAVATIKRQLQLLLPGVRVFLDIDDMEVVDELEHYVEASQAMLVLLGSSRYLTSANCQRELNAAQHAALPIIRVHEHDPQKNGTPLVSLRYTATQRLTSQQVSMCTAHVHRTSPPLNLTPCGLLRVSPGEFPLRWR